MFVKVVDGVFRNFFIIIRMSKIVKIFLSLKEFVFNKFVIYIFLFEFEFFLSCVFFLLMFCEV